MIYGEYQDYVDSGIMCKEEAARKTREDWRLNNLIQALNAIRNAPHDERLRADKHLKNAIYKND